jgi:tetratricopeptide (TPR) repeat protein
MMTRFLFSITTSLAATLAIASLSAVADNAPIGVNGGMVDPHMPATYRLPPVSPPEAAVAVDPAPIFLPPANDPTTPPLPTEECATIAMNQSQSNSTPLPAGAPPDDGRADDTTAGSAAASVEGPQDALPPMEPPSEPIQTVAVNVVPADATGELTPQLLPAVQRGTGLAQRGALFAARTEFIQVLRRLAQGKDAAANSDEHSRALAAGLRALDEAEDFVPSGVQLEAEMNVRAVASSHRTRVLPDEPETVTPFEAVALYHSFVQEQLAKAAAGERAGSMALYGLGRVHARLAAQSDDDVEQTRAATTMYTAALAACPDNHLAANELGVLACRAGRAMEATELFQRAIDVAPSATAYHNLAMAQQKMGMHGESSTNEQESQRIAAWERSQGDVSRRAGVRWVAPDELARASQPNQWTAEATNQPAPQLTTEPAQGKFQISKIFARQGSGQPNESLQPANYPQVSRPVGQAAGQRRWR